MKKSLSIISWNVNGLRAIERKEAFHTIADGTYDIIGIQETKVSDPGLLSDQVLHPDGYHSFWHCSTTKKGYSGVGLYTKTEPLSVVTDFGANTLSEEGRVIQAEFDSFYLFTIYFPNGGSGEARLAYKLAFYKEFIAYTDKLKKKGKPIIFMGDVNTAHQEIDLARPKQNINTSGFMSIEREWLDTFEEHTFVDTFRHMHPDKAEQYTWWDMKSGARARNIGWRIDYVYVQKELLSRVKDAFILPSIIGSDHCPVGISLEV
ncbi:MAG: exodeoxyribonuclease III [Candidatus Moranbacteria bacterium]|nr:exodeoxyribonuclease III [Candidatus Moranbacteria bacterium]